MRKKTLAPIAVLSLVVVALALASFGGIARAGLPLASENPRASPNTSSLYPPSDCIRIRPSNPTENDRVQITVFGTWGDSCVPYYVDHDIADDTITIWASTYYGPDVMCMMVLTDFDFTVSVGKLSAGDYTVLVYVYNWWSCDTTLYCCATFCVAPGDTTPPSIGTPSESDDPINKDGCPPPSTVTITSEITDDDSGVDRARLYYWLDHGTLHSEWMSHTGDSYYATIGPFSEAGTVRYYIKAWDEAGNMRQSSSYTVTVDDCWADVRVSSSLTLSKAVVDPGENVTASFTIHNYGDGSFGAQLLGVGGRGPGGEDDIQDFPFVQGPFVLLPGRSYTYTGARSFSTPGQYHFGVLYQDDKGHWHDIPANPGVSREAVLQVRDNEGPSITNIEESNDPIYTQGCDVPTEVTPDKITISTKVNDSSGVAWVGIEYWESTDAWHNSQDMLKGFLDVYRAELGPFDKKQTILYRIRARDTFGNESASPTYEFRVLTCCFVYSTGFDPATDAFKFKNCHQWSNLSDGRCLGMSLAVWDYWHYNKEIPGEHNHWIPCNEQPQDPLTCYTIWRHLIGNNEARKVPRERRSSYPDLADRNRIEFKEVMRSLRTGEPVVLGVVVVLDQEKGREGRHAILIVRGTDCPEFDTYELRAYDPNKVSEDTGAQLVELQLLPTSSSNDSAGLKFKYGSYNELYSLSPDPLYTYDPDEVPQETINTTCDWAMKSTEDLESRGYTVSEAYGGTHLKRSESETHSFYALGGTPLAVSLRWGGSTFKLALYRPDGSLYEERQSSQPPLITEVPNAEPGEWAFKVTAVSVPSEGELYVALAGIKYHRVYLPLIMKNHQ